MNNFSLMLPFVFALIITACAVAPEPPAAAPAVTAVPAKISVRVGDALLLGEDSPARQQLLAQVERFEQQHPQIDLILEPWIWTPQEFKTQLQKGQTPDVMEVAATEGHLIINGGYAADLTELMYAWPVSSDFNQSLLNPFIQAGRIYAVPRIIYIMGLFYDKKLFKTAGLVDSSGDARPPTTWAEFVAAAKTIKTQTGAAGFCILTQSNQGGWNFMNWGWQAGGDFERQESRRWRATLAEPPIVEAMTFIKNLRWDHDILQDNLFIDGSHLLPMIATHQCGMAIIVPDAFDASINEYGGNPDDLGLTVLPAGPAGRSNLMGGSFTIIRAQAPPEVQQAAFEWIAWRGFNLLELENELKAPAGRTRWAFSSRGLLYRPNSPTGLAEKELLDKYHSLPYYRIYRTYFEEAGQAAQPEPPVAPQEIYAALDTVLQKILTDPSADPQSLLEVAAQKLQAEYFDSAD